MKYIIVGLGVFGSSLAEKLTAQGNEVIGIDTDMGKVEASKERVTHTICMDAMDAPAVEGLPLDQTDVVIIAIGEDQGVNVMVSAMFKNLKVKRLISRAINPLHEKVLEAIGVDGVVSPEAESAERWAKKLAFQNVIDSFELSDEYSIIEVKAPPQFIGKSLKEIPLRSEYRLLALTTIKRVEAASNFGKKQLVNRVQGVASSETIIEADDILVVYGANKDLRRLMGRG